MQVREVATEGLVRQFHVVVPAAEIESRVNGRLEDLKGRVRMPGFRPGKAPLNLLKKQYGRSIVGEVVEEALDEGTRKALGDNNLKPALRPQIENFNFEEGKDLEFGMKVEVLPEVPAVDLNAIKLVRLVAEADEARIDQTLQNLAKAWQSFKAPEEPRPAEMGDRLTISFQGTIDGEAFEGGSADDMPIVLGSNVFVPGFEEQLVGANVGDERTVEVTFPDGDGIKPELKGKPARFTVTVKAIEAPEPLAIDDEFAKKVGLADLADLRKNLKERLESEYKSRSRTRIKRQLMDQLAELYTFDVPPGMVDMEFETIWKQLEEEAKRTGESIGEEGKSEEEVRAEYRKIAERRVRLGLVLSDIGNKNDVKVENHELQQAMIGEAQRFPGQERKIFEYFRNNPGSLDALRAPIFEDKVVDLILEQADVSESKVDVETILQEPDEDEDEPVVAAAEPQPSAAV